MVIVALAKKKLRVTTNHIPFTRALAQVDSHKIVGKEFSSMEKFKVNDRVRRKPYTVTLANDVLATNGVGDGEANISTYSTRGCVGTVKALREETTLTSKESRERSIMVDVLWDNGTRSYLGPEGLEMAR